MHRLFFIVFVLSALNGFAQKQKQKNTAVKTTVAPKKVAIVNKKATPVTKTKVILAKVKEPNKAKKEKTPVKSIVVHKTDKPVKGNKQEKIVASKKNKFIAAKQVLKKKAIVAKVISQKKEVIVKKKIVPTIVEPTFSMVYPFAESDATIKQHYGLIYIHHNRYKNESVTFNAAIESDVLCGVDSAIVGEIYEDADGLYTVFLKKGKYTIALSNLASVDVNENDLLRKNTIIGFIADDEMDTRYGCLEMMLFKNNTIINPEKHLHRDATQTSTKEKTFHSK